jgi:hypothetical protein
MIDTSFIRQTDKKYKEQIENYEKLYQEYYKIKPKKKKGTDELYFTKEQEKEQHKILNSSLNKFKLYFSENCNGIFKNITKLVKNVQKQKSEKLRIKKQLIIQIFESELSYLKEIIQTPKLTLFLRKHIELKLDVYLMAIEFSLPKLTQKGEYDDMGDLEYPDLEDEQFNEQIYFKKEFNELKYVNEYAKKGFQLSSAQQFLKTYMSEDTPYNGILVNHGVGQGKTCTGITIAENYKYKIKSEKKKIYILTPSSTLNDTWKNEIFNISKEENKTVEEKDVNKQCTGTFYTEFYNSLGNMTTEGKKRSMTKFIRDFYLVNGYQTFVNNIKKNVEKRKQKNNTHTYEALEILYIKETFSNCVFVMDEVHMTRLGSDDKNKIAPPYLELIARYAENTKFVLLSATPIFDKPEEIIWLLNLLLWNDKKAPMLEEYIFQKKLTDGVDKKTLIKKSRGYVSYLRGGDPTRFATRFYPDPSISYFYNEEKNKTYWGETPPSKKFKEMQLITLPDWGNRHIVMTQHYMSDFQYKRYIESEGVFGQKGIAESLIGLNVFELGDKSRKKTRTEPFLIKSGEQYEYNSKSDAIKGGVSFLNIDRICEYSTKYYGLCNLIKNSDGPVFIYTQKLANGIKTISMMLEENGMERYVNAKGNKEFQNFLQKGQRKTPRRQQIFAGLSYIYVDSSSGIDNSVMNEWFGVFNQQKNVIKGNPNSNIKVILGSDKIAQGINLFRMREVHIIEPWYNLNKIEQIIGRGTRSFGHKGLPENKKNITIYLHVSTVPPNKHKEIDKIAEKESLTGSQKQSLYSSDLQMYHTSYNKKEGELVILNLLSNNAIDCNLHLGINQNTPRTINQIDSQGNKREYQKCNSCALFNVISETYCKKELQVTCNPDFKNLDQEDELNKITTTTYNYFQKGNIKIEDASYFIKELFKNYYILTYSEIKDHYSSYLSNVNIPYDNNVFQIGLNKVLEDNVRFRNKTGSLGKIKHKFILENEDDHIYVFEIENKPDRPLVYRYYDEIEYKNPSEKLLEGLEDSDSEDSKDSEDVNVTIDGQKSKEKSKSKEESIETKIDKPDEPKKAKKAKTAKKPSAPDKIMFAYLHESFLVKLNEQLISAKIKETTEILLSRMKHTFQAENKYTFSKDTIPFYPSILSLGAYDGHLVGESTSSKHVILKQLTDLQKSHKMSVNKMENTEISFTHDLKIGDSIHTSKVIYETDEEILLENINGQVIKIDVDKRGRNHLKVDRHEANTKYIKKNIPSIENIEKEQEINIENKNYLILRKILKTKIIFSELEELFRNYSIDNIRAGKDKIGEYNTNLNLQKKSFYMSFLGSFLIKRLNKGEQPPTTVELLKECHRLRKLTTQKFNDNNFFLSIDRYMRYYMLDRLQPIEKKILLEYILDKYIVDADTGSIKEPSIEDIDILKGEHHIIDYFIQNFGLTETPIYILNHNDHVYYRIYEFSQEIKPRSAPIQSTRIKYFDGVSKKQVSVTIEKELERKFKITHHHIGIIDYKYCNHFGMINSILEEPDGNNKVYKDIFGQSHVATFALNIADMNNNKIQEPSIKKRRSGVNVNTASNMFYKKNKIGANNALYYTLIDMYQHLFNLPQVAGRVGGATDQHSYKNYIKITKQQKPEASIILEDNPEPIVIKFNPQQFGKGNKNMGTKAQKPELLMKYELMSRLLRDIATKCKEMGSRRMPLFWFINTDEVNSRFLPQFADTYHNKTWVREWDYVHKMCNQFDKLLELDKKKKLKCEKCDKNRKDGHQLYFNENNIVCGEHRSRGGAGKPKENMSLIGDVEILQLEDPPDDPYYAVPDELEPQELSKVFGFINTNYNSCIFSSKFN